MLLEALNSFCWTKMQAEGGETLSAIISRKNLEREAGAGTFYWGIGNGLGRRAAALHSGQVDRIIFSKMLTRPRAEDKEPDGVALWLQYEDIDGTLKELPPHVIVTSRASSKRGPKKRHYALVCRSEQPLRFDNYGRFNLGCYQNYGSNNPRIGFSQVTTVVERMRQIEGVALERSGPIYEANLMAVLMPPFYVKLVNPVLLSTKVAKELRKAMARISEVDDYLEVALQVREEAKRH